MAELRHRCDERDCCSFGQPSSRTCGCHRTSDQMKDEKIAALEREVVDLRDHLLMVAISGTERELTALDRLLTRISPDALVSVQALAVMLGLGAGIWGGVL